MKLAWFSPLPPAHSDLANFTERLRGELQRRCELRVFTETPDGFLEPSTGASYPSKIGHDPHDLVVSLNAGDLPIYNLGNNPDFFARTWFLNRFKPGLVILHDVKLHHFFEGLYCRFLHDPGGYLDVLEQQYGAFGRQAGKAYLRATVPIDFVAGLFPMTAWAVQNALGLVVHHAHALEEVRKLTTVPVWTIPLPYEPRSSGGPERPRGGAGFSPARPAKLVIFGYLNRNRRIIEFLHALATMPERDAFAVHVFGTMVHEREVNAAVDLLGLRGRVTLHGHVPGPQLEAALDDADLAVNLRYPSMGEASGSQLRIWDHALPSLVTRTEGYARLPADTVCFVRPENEREDIQRHLRRLLRHPGFFREKGRRARRALLAHHRPAQYVDALLPICEQAAALRSRRNRLWLAERVGRAVAPWSENGPPDDLTRAWAARIAGTV